MAFIIIGNYWGHSTKEVFFLFQNTLKTLECICCFWKCFSPCHEVLKCFFNILSQCIPDGITSFPIDIWNSVQSNWWKICHKLLLACNHDEFTFFLFVLSGSNSSNWVWSVNGGDDFWSSWYSPVFQWLRGTWQMFFEKKNSILIRVTLQSLWRQMCFTASQ